MKYNFDLEGEPKRAPRVSLHGKSQLRINLALLAKLAKEGVSDVKKLEEIESIVRKSLRALNEI